MASRHVKFIPHKYGMVFPLQIPDWQVELEGFRLSWPSQQGGLGKYGHLERAARMLFPSLTWNDWLVRMWKAFCDDSYIVHKSEEQTVRVISLTGVASASKTFSSTRFILLSWLASPLNSIAILTTVSKLNAGQRIWPVIQSGYYEARQAIADLHKITTDKVDLGNLVDSRKILEAMPGRADRAIHVQSVKEGGVAKAEAFIRGQHAPRILVFIDEADETPEAIFRAVANLRKGCQDLTIIVASNPSSRLNPHGRCCQPRGGWANRPKDSFEWLTEGVPEWQIDPGICLMFHGHDSPNVRAGRTIYPFIYTFEDYQNSLRPGVRNTLQYWKYDAGDWPPDGVCKTVFNDTMAVACRLQERVSSWLEAPIPVSFLDPGFGGDACIQTIGLLGRVRDDRRRSRPRQTQSAFPPLSPPSYSVLQVIKTIDLELVAGFVGPDGKQIDYEHQIASQVCENCKQHKVEAKNFGLFATGTGRGVASILYTDWSGDIFQVQEGGSPSELPLSESDPEPANKKCDRRVTELWFSARGFGESEQLCGIPNETLVELCAREYTTIGKPWKYRIEEKDEFRPKLGHSPDRADSLVGLCELVKVRHGLRGGNSAAESAPPAQSWDEEAAALAAGQVATYSNENEREALLGVETEVDISEPVW